MDTSTLRVYDLPPEMRREFDKASPEARRVIWPNFYAFQLQEDRRKAAEVRAASERGERIPDTNFNRRALGLEPH